VIPTGYQSPVIKADIIFEHITYETNESASVYFVISRQSSSFKMEKKCYIMIDDKNFELPVESEGTEYKTGQESSSTTTTVKDSLKVKTESTLKTNSFNWFDEKFVIRLTPEIKNSMFKTNKLLFRFYFGPKDGTFSFTGYSLKRVKGLFEL